MCVFFCLLFAGYISSINNNRITIHIQILITMPVHMLQTACSYMHKIMCMPYTFAFIYDFDLDFQSFCRNPLANTLHKVAWWIHYSNNNKNEFARQHHSHSAVQQPMCAITIECSSIILGLAYQCDHIKNIQEMDGQQAVCDLLHFAEYILDLSIYSAVLW